MAAHAFKPSDFPNEPFFTADELDWFSDNIEESNPHLKVDNRILVDASHAHTHIWEWDGRAVRKVTRRAR